MLFGKMLAERFVAVKYGGQEYLFDKEEFERFRKTLIGFIEASVKEIGNPFFNLKSQRYHFTFNFKYTNPPEFVKPELIDFILRSKWSYDYEVTERGPNGKGRIEEKRLFRKPMTYAVYQIVITVNSGQFVGEYNDYIVKLEKDKAQDELDALDRRSRSQ